MNLVCSFKQNAGEKGGWIEEPTPQHKGHFRVELWRQFENEKGGIEKEYIAVLSKPGRTKKIKTMGYGEFHKNYVVPLVDQFLEKGKEYVSWGFECRRWS